MSDGRGDGARRASFLDLSAGPFAWGPALGSRGGARGPGDVPDVDLRFGHLDAETQMPDPGADARLERELERGADARFERLGVDPEDEAAYVRAELDVYEAFARKHCERRARASKLCETLRARVETLASAAARGSDETTGESVASRLAAASIFGDDANAINATVARDLFMSELGRVLSSYLTRHVAPATARFAPRYRAKVRVLTYVVDVSPSGGGFSGRASEDDGAASAFDPEAVREAVRGLAPARRTSSSRRRGSARRTTPRWRRRSRRASARDE